LSYLCASLEGGGGAKDGVTGLAPGSNIDELWFLFFGEGSLSEHPSWPFTVHVIVVPTHD
jgi:hypothetical protein